MDFKPHKEIAFIQQSGEITLPEHHGALQNLIDHHPSSMYSVDRGYRYTAFNQAHASAMSKVYEAQIELGKIILDYIVNPEYREMAKQKLDRALIGGEKFRDQEYLINPNSFFNISYIPIKDETNTIIGVSIFAEDVTELKKKEDALKNAEIDYHDLFESMNSVILVIDPETKSIMDANGTACKFYGYSHAELMQLKVSDLAVLSAEEIQDHVSKVNEGKTTQLQHAHRLANGEIRDLDIYAATTHFKGKRVNLAVIHDISARKEIENALKLIEDRYKAQFKNLPIPTYTWQRKEKGREKDKDGEKEKDFILIDYNNAAEIFTNGQISNLLGKSASELYANEPDVIADMEKCIEEQVTIQREKQMYLRSTGLNRSLIVTYVYIPSDLVIVHTEDVTERKTAGEKLRESEENYRNFVEQSFDGIIFVDEQGNITEWNHAREVLTGLKKEDVLGRPYWDVRHQLVSPELQTPENLQRFKSHTLEMLKTGQSPFLNRPSEGIIVTVNGEEKFIEQTAFPVKTKNGYGIRSLSRDVTARKQAEEKLRESEERFRLLFEHSQAILLIVEPTSGEILDANPAAANFYGYALNQLRGMFIEQINILPPEEVSAQRQKALHESLNFFVFPHRLANGEIRTVEVHSSPILMKNRQVLFSIVHDITERIRAEEARRESDAKYRLLFENMQEGFSLHEIITDENDHVTDFRFLDANAAYERHTGMKPSEIIGRTILEVMPTADMRQIESYGRVALTGEPIVFEYRSNTYNRYFRVRALSPQRRFFATIFEDITERKQAEIILRESEERFSTAFHSSQDAISISRVSDGIYLDVNEAFCAAFDIAREKVIGHNGREVNLWVNPERRKKLFQIIREKGRATNFEAEYRSTTGRTGTMLASCDSIHISGQECLLIVGHDITEQKKTEAKLQAAHDLLEQRVHERTAELQTAVVSLEKAGQVKNEFLSSMGHELRTPLNGILGNVEMLQLQVYGALTEKQSRALNNIDASGKHLMDLLKAILDFSQLQSGTLLQNVTTCSLGEICTSALETIAGSFAAKHQETSFTISPNMIMLQTDEQRVRQILLNLLDNAAKFTPEGGRFGIDVVGDRQYNLVKISVWDTGIGIRDEDQSKLFRPFIQLDARLAREYEGAGLGLAVVKQLTELFGGSISVESTPFQGSRFTVTLPWLD